MFRLRRYQSLFGAAIVAGFLALPLLGGSALKAAPQAPTYAFIPMDLGPNGLAVVDTSTATQVAFVPIPGRIYGAAVSHDGARVFATDHDGNLWFFDASGLPGAVPPAVKMVPTPTPACACFDGFLIEPVLSADETVLYVTDERFNGLYAFDTTTLAQIDHIALFPDPNAGIHAWSADVTPDGKYVYVAAWNYSYVIIVDVQDPSHMVVANTLDLRDPALPYFMPNATPQSVRVSPDGAKAYVTADGGGGATAARLLVIDTATQTVVNAIPISERPRGLAISPDGTKAYVAHLTGSQAVSEIDLTSGIVLRQSVSLGGNPGGMAITADGLQLYVGRQNGGPLVMNIADFSYTNLAGVGRSFALGKFVYSGHFGGGSGGGPVSIPGLVAHYTFDHDDASDSSGNALHGVPMGNPTFAPGPAGFGDSLVVDTGKYIVLPQTNLLSLYDHDFTVSAWVNAAAFNGLGGYGSDWAVLGNQLPNPAPGGAGLHLVLRGGQPYMGFFGNDLGSGTNLSLNTWYHIAWRYTKGSGEMAMFLGGNQISSGGGHAPFLGTGSTYIGRCCETWDAPRYAKGQIDDVQIYDRPLTQTEIASLVMPSAPADTTPPAIAATVTGTLGANGWYTSDATVTWTVTDDESTATPTGCNAQTVTADTDGVTFTCSAASDGGSASQSVTIKRDATKPTITALRTPANAAGWNNTDVVVGFTCGDALSGMASCVGDTTLTTEGAGQVVTGTATDRAGNQAFADVSPINIDKTSPVVTAPAGVNTSAASAAGTVVTYPAATVIDNGSGAGVVVCAPASGSTFPIGTTVVSCSATDAAGNTGTATFSVTVSDVTTPGEMRGEGFVKNGSDKYEFHFDVREQARGERGSFSLEVDYGQSSHDNDDKKGKNDEKKSKSKVEKREDDRFRSTGVTFVAFSDDPSIRPGRNRKVQIDTVYFTGTGMWNGHAGYTFEVSATDQGEPGRHREMITMVIRNAAGAIVAQAGGDIDGGNVQSVRISHGHDTDDHR